MRLRFAQNLSNWLATTQAEIKYISNQKAPLEHFASKFAIHFINFSPAAQVFGVQIEPRCTIKSVYKEKRWAY